MSERTITIDSIGPLSKPVVITAQPGIGVLTGFCGTGKSFCLEAIGVALGNKDKGRVAPSAGKKRGTVECLGVVLNVSAGRITRTGDTEAASIEEFTLADLINPPVKDESAKNRHGIKSLLRLTKAEADPKLFYRLAGDKAAFEKVISPDDVKSADLVEMAGKVKRAFEKEANAIQKQAEREEAAAAANRDAMKGLDEKAPHDARQLQEAHTTAVQVYARIREQWDAWHAAQRAAEIARAELAKITGGKETHADYDRMTEECKQIYQNLDAEVEALQKQLDKAKHGAELARLNWKRADDQAKAFAKHQQATAGWQQTIDAAAGGSCPDAKAVQNAEIAVEDAQEAIEAGAVLRNAMQRAADAKARQEAADKLRKEAHRLDLAAKGTDAILSEAVASERFSVDCTLLMGKLPTGEVKPYYDLSAGEKCMIAVAEKIDRVCAVRTDPSQLAIVDLDQSNFQEIPDSVRDRLDAYARERNCFVSTAMVTDDAELGYFLWSQRKNGVATPELIGAQ